MPTDIKYGHGYVRLMYDDGTEVRVTVEKKNTTSSGYKPMAVKNVAALAEALR